MFVSFLEPYPIRNVKAPFLWIYYKQLNHFKKNEICFIGSEDYFQNPTQYKNRSEFNKYAMQKNRYQIPTKEYIDTYTNFIINNDIYNVLEQKYQNRTEIYTYLLTHTYEPLMDKLRKYLSQIDDIEAILAWANSPSLNQVAKEFDIKIIYNEQGPFRNPLYFQTAYFDFKGINGNTSSYERFLNFQKADVELLKIEEIKTLFLNDYKKDKICCNYNLGIALQVEDDSNILAYSNGYNTLRLLNDGLFFYDKKDILIRKHPLGFLDVSDKFGVLDESQNSIEFIEKCSKIMTINSSIGIEALLFEKDVIIKGESAYSFFINSNYDLTEFLNFFMIAYLISYDCLFDIEYYRWRLTNPSEKEIFERHKQILLDYRGIKDYNYNLTKQLLINKIDKLKQTIETKDNQIDELKQTIETKDNQIDELKQIIESKDNQIDKLKQTIESKDNQIDELNQTIKENTNIIIKNNKTIQNLTKLNEKYKNEILMYISSDSWKITRPIRKIMKILKGK